MTDTSNATSFTYRRDGDYLLLNGKMGNDTVFIKLKRFDEKNFRLMSRGFHWINEYPYNR